MPYIGTTPTKVVSRQSANVYRYTATAGQSVFTGADLDNNVLACNPADMIVHMNGLRLESTDYTATSASVTLTTAATAGDEVTVTSFVTFEVADTYTKTAADDRYVNTTGDTMTGALALPTGGLTVGTDQLAVDSAGRVTMPYQPSFGANRSVDTSYTSTGVAETVVFDTVWHNIGGHYDPSTGVFTAPVSGLYQFNCLVRFDLIGSGYMLTRAYINNGAITGLYSISQSFGSYETRQFSFTYYLNAGDNVRVTAYSHSDASWRVDNQSSFSGYLIG